jgi:hypothetical protein
VNDELTRRTALGGIACAGAGLHPAAAQIRQDLTTNASVPVNFFVGPTIGAAVAAAETAVAKGTYFKAVGRADNTVEWRLRTAAGSQLLYTEVTGAALASDHGFTLIRGKRSEPGTFARTAAQMEAAGIMDRQVSIMHWINPDFDEAIRNKTLNEDISGMIQRGLDNGARSFPAGHYYCTSGLKVPHWAHLIGEGYQPGAPPSDPAVNLKFNLRNGSAFSCGHNPTFENLFFTNVAGSFDDDEDLLTGTSAACISLLDNVALIRTSFALWATAVSLGPSTYYAKADMVEFNRCFNGYEVNGSAPYDIHIDKPISRKTRTFFAGDEFYPARNIKIYGGSIEGFSRVAMNFLDLSAFGTYFETTAPHDSCVAIEPNTNEASVSLYGNLIFMNFISRFVNMSNCAGAMLTGSGNVFDGTGRRAGVCYSLPASGSVSLAGDRFGARLSDDLKYVDPIVTATKFNGITFPELPSTNKQSAYGGRTLIGSQGFVGVGLAAEPASKVTGVTVMADGNSWDPLRRTGGGPYWVVWQGDRWTDMSGRT